LKNKVKIIAEIANAHQGSSLNALKLANSFAKAGADAIKFQIYSADELLTKNHKRYKHFKKQAFSKVQWGSLISKTKNLGVEVYADIFGVQAYKIAKKYQVDGYKIHSSDLSNTHLLELLSREKKKIFLATGGSTILEIYNALQLLNKTNKQKELTLLHGFQSYPTSTQDSNLNRLRILKDQFGLEVKIGYSDHISGDDPFATILPILTLPYGVSYIEKHVTFDRDKKGVDYYSSYEPDQFKKFIFDIRRAENSLGSEFYSFPEEEKKYRDSVKKSWTSHKFMKKGKIISKKDIIMKRTSQFTHPLLSDEIVGKKLKKSILAEQTITRDVLENKVLAIIVARMESSRLPKKAIKPINNKPAIEHLFERISIAKKKGFVDTIAFCTTTLKIDNELAKIASKYDLKIYRGDIDDVLSRMMLAINDNQDHDTIIRITGDDILIDPIYLDKTVKYHQLKNAQYTDAKKLPSGTDIEVFQKNILKTIFELSNDSSGSEYLTNYVTNNIDQFEVASLEVIPRHNQKLRLTMDTQEDYKLISQMLNYFKKKKKEFTYTMDDIFDFFKKNPNSLKINNSIKQKSLPKNISTTLNWKRLSLDPLITVYITNFNYSNYIKQAVESVLNQKHQDFELIIIDDGSTDNSKKIIEEYKDHPKINIIYQKNKGLNVTNNIATRLSRGKFIIRLDADDFLNENALLLMVQELEGNDDIGLVFSDYYLVNKEGSIITEEKRHDFTKVTLLDQPAHGACTMIRKSFLKELGGYSNDFTCQDGYELWIKMTKDKKVCNINLPLFNYRKHGENLTENKERLYRTRHRIIKKHLKLSNIKQKKHLAIVPIRDEDENSWMLDTILGSTLIDITLKNLMNSKFFKTIVVTTPNKKILDYLKKKYKTLIKYDNRPENLARFNSLIDNTVAHVLKKFSLKKYDTISIINCEYPLRKDYYFEKAINTLYLFDAESVISVIEENSNFYQHKGDGLIPLKSNKNLRLEREFIYRETGGIHVVNGKYFNINKRILGTRNSHIVLDSNSALKVNNNNEFIQLKKLYKE
jgi:sialic acid synthase SpsE/spore coat polysaccharide biosynthesis protein SpsF (cytidylyltransferase family)